MEQATVYKFWRFDFNVLANGDIQADPRWIIADDAPGQTDIAAFYCPSRRTKMEATGNYAVLWRVDREPGTRRQLLTRPWTKGGNDYAACAGSGDVFNEQFRATWDLLPQQIQQQVNNGSLQVNQHQSNIGVFGVNSSVSIDNIKDGTSQTMLIAEAARLTDTTSDLTVSSDGWAWGGPATLFSALVGPNKRLSWEYAGGPHEGIVQIGLADGSVQAVSESVNLSIWQRLGNYANGLPAKGFKR